MAGGNVCRVHGGAAPQVKRRAAERLAALVDPAIGVISAALRDKKQPKIAFDAARDVLDRAGFKKPDAVQIQGELSIADVLRARRAKREAAEALEVLDPTGVGRQRIAEDPVEAPADPADSKAH
jgi:hypothetical protein